MQTFFHYLKSRNWIYSQNIRLQTKISNCRADSGEVKIADLGVSNEFDGTDAFLTSTAGWRHNHTRANKKKTITRTQLVIIIAVHTRGWDMLLGFWYDFLFPKDNFNIQYTITSCRDAGLHCSRVAGECSSNYLLFQQYNIINSLLAIIFLSSKAKSSIVSQKKATISAFQQLSSYPTKGDHQRPPKKKSNHKHDCHLN